jgi:hypothetical protein
MDKNIQGRMVHVQSERGLVLSYPDHHSLSEYNPETGAWSFVAATRFNIDTGFLYYRRVTPVAKQTSFRDVQREDVVHPEISEGIPISPVGYDNSALGYDNSPGGYDNINSPGGYDNINSAVGYDNRPEEITKSPGGYDNSPGGYDNSIYY